MRARTVGDVLELTQDCDIGAINERCVVVEVEGRYMALVFPNRKFGRRWCRTGTDYKFLRVA